MIMTLRNIVEIFGIVYKFMMIKELGLNINDQWLAYEGFICILYVRR